MYVHYTVDDGPRSPVCPYPQVLVHEATLSHEMVAQVCFVCVMIRVQALGLTVFKYS